MYNVWYMVCICSIIIMLSGLNDCVFFVCLLIKEMSYTRNCGCLRFIHVLYNPIFNIKDISRLFIDFFYPEFPVLIVGFRLTPKCFALTCTFILEGVEA